MIDSVLVQATLEDIPFLVNLRKTTMVEHLEAMGLFLSETEHLDRIQHRFECAHIVMRESEAVGMLKFAERESEIEIIQMQILPALQGQGVGSSLIRVLASRGKTLVLSVLKNNPARQLYERMGFCVTGEDTYQFEMKRAPAAQSG